MKTQKTTILFLIFAFSILAITSVAQPDWSVNPNQYVYSMTITGKVSIDNKLSENPDDMVAAFINGECRGVANVKYQSVLDEYFVFLMIYSNDPIDTITIKIYDAANDNEIETKLTLDFEVNGIIGSVSSPFMFSENSQSFGYEIISFEIYKQIGSTYINNSIIYLLQEADGDLSSIAPVFQLSVGAKAFVNGIEQESGVTINDFRKLVKYTVVSGAGISKIYSVTIRKAIDPSTKIALSNTTVAENKDSVFIGEITVNPELLETNYEFSLSPVSQSENEFFYIEDNKLFAKGPFNFEQQSQYAVNIKLDTENGNSRQKLFVIDVLDRNDPPLGILLTTSVLSESTNVNSWVARLTVEDEDENDIHKFTFKAGNGENDKGNDFFSINGDSLVLEKSLKELEQDTFSIFIEVTDSSNSTFKREWDFKITDMNFAPKFLNKPLNYAIQNQVYVYSVEVADAEGDQLEISFENLPDWLKYNNVTKLLSGIPLNEDVADYIFNIVVSDGEKVSKQLIALSVLNVNDPPEINIFPASQLFITNTENSVELPKNCIIDPDVDDELIFRMSLENNSMLPLWMNFNTETMVLSGNPTKNQLGEYSLKLTAIDKGKLTEWVVFKLEVAIPTAINKVNQLGFKVYPNPFDNRIYIDIPKGEEAIVGIYNMSGQQIKQVNLSSGIKKSISVEDILPGIYIIKVQQKGKIFIQKVIK